LVDAPVHHRRELDAHEDDRPDHHHQDNNAASAVPDQPPPPQYPASEASSPRPPPFSSLYAPLSQSAPAAGDRSNPGKYIAVAASSSEGEASGSHAAPAYTQLESDPLDPDQAASRAFCDPVGETKLALPRDTKGESSRKDEDAAEPPPAYSEGISPLLTFVYLMAAAGGASSIITQVQQGGPPVNALGGRPPSFALRLVVHFSDLG
jgi:G patch domain-containing protein 1